MSGEFDEIWALYADDGAQSLDAMEASLACLDRVPDDGEAIAALFRAMHTFKGNSRILGLAVVEALAHAAEDLIGMVRDDGVRLDRELEALLLEAVDMLRTMLEGAVATRLDASPEHSSALLARMLAAQKNRLNTTPLAANAEPLSPPEEEVFEDALVFETGAAPSFAEDPLYREIFFDLVRPAVEKIARYQQPFDADTCTTISDELAAIRDAADRIGMPHWPALVDAARVSLEEPEAFAQVIAQMQLALPDAPGRVNDDSPVEGCVPEQVLLALDALMCANTEEERAPQSLDVIRSWAEGTGYPGVVDACAAVAEAANARARRRPLFQLGDGLARVDVAEPSPVAQRLEAWCGAGVNDTLAHLAELLGVASPIDWPAVLDELRAFSAACRHFGWTTSLEVTQVLADICARVGDGNLAADPVLTRLLAAYTEAARAMAQASTAPRAIDLGPLERILQQTVSAAGSLCHSGFEVVPELADIPVELRTTLSPESAAAVRQALADGRCLHVVHADVAEDTAIAERFAVWLTAAEVKSLACATVFEDDRTTFDFLLATHEGPQEIDHALAAIDESEVRLQRKMTVGAPGPDGRVGPEGTSAAALDAAGLQEAIGELAVARSCVRQTLGDYIEADLPAAIDRILSTPGDRRTDARGAVASLMEGWQDKLRQLMQLEIQASTEFARLEDLAAKMMPENRATRVVDGMVVRVSGHNYVLPIGVIERIITLDERNVVHVSAAAGRSVVRLNNDEVVPLIHIDGADEASASDLRAEQETEAQGTYLVMVARTPGGAVAVSIDELVGQQSVFSKPLHGYLEGVRAVSGYAVLNSGDVGMLLDVAKLAQAA